MFSMYDGDHLSEGVSPDDYAYLEDGTADLPTGLASLGFIRGVLRRAKRVWCAFAVAGLIIGVGFSVAFPPSYQASTSLLLTPVTAAGEVASTCCPASGPIFNEQTLAGSREVAALAIQKLGLNTTVNSFLKTYTVTTVTDRVLLITANAKSGPAAVSHATAIAAAFFQFRQSVAQSAQNLVNTALNQQISQAQQSVKSIDTKISQVSAQPSSSAQAAQLKALKADAAQANLGVTNLQTAAAATAATAQITTDTVVQDSRVLNPATLTPHSKLKRTVEYAVLGLFAGLLLSIAVIIIGALMSDRLRRRDDIAQALGAPVAVSTGPVGLSRWRSGGKGLAVARNFGVKRIIAYLDNAVPPSPRGPASLAVVPADDVQVPAVCLASLALSCAQRGLQVVVADLCPGAPAARLLGAADPGVKTVSAEGTHLIVAIPERDDMLPAGPLKRGQGRARAAEPLVQACASADVLLTLAPLDPSLGAEYLTGWTRNAVVMVTTGRSTAARIHAVGEMVRLAGMALISGILVGADKTDESLGATVTPIAGDEAGLPAQGPGLYVGADGTPGRRPSDD
jgi:capsular polysaccharide biosynthesis protein